MPVRVLPPLRIVSVAYLSLPWLVFFAAWLRPGWGLLAAALLIATALRYFRGCREGDDEPWPARTIVLAIVTALVAVSLSGAGGVGLQNLPDWDNKNVLMNDLLARQWPVGYADGRVMNYYFALYLPPAVIGRLTDWNGSQWAEYLEILLGFVLVLLWVVSFARGLGIKAAWWFLLFGGLDLVGWLLLRHGLPRPGASLEWWDEVLQFSSNATLLDWVPQHALAGWLLSSLIIDSALRLRSAAFTGLFLGLGFLWSPFVTLGLVPVGIAAWLIVERRGWLTPANLAFFPAMLVLAYVFYAPHQGGGDMHAGAAVWADHFSGNSLLRIGVLLVLEVGVYLACVFALRDALGREWRIIAITVAVASLAWTVAPDRVGHGGFNMRASIPTLFLLFLLVMQVLGRPGSVLPRRLLYACLVVGAASAMQETIRSVTRYPAVVPAPRPHRGVMQLRDRQREEFLMPADSRAYHVLFRDARAS